MIENETKYFQEIMYFQIYLKFRFITTLFQSKFKRN